MSNEARALAMEEAARWHIQKASNADHHASLEPNHNNEQEWVDRAEYHRDDAAAK